jgi:prepilin-type N-terminal cleavage/methylation domain-containing protein
MLTLMKRNRQKGFTLIELLIVVAIIGIIAALLIPNFLDALQKAKQKRSVADMRNIGTAMFSWLTDQVGAAAAGQDAAPTVVDISNYEGGPLTPDELAAELSPRYIQEIPDQDGWKNPYEFYLNIANPLVENVMLIRSGGRDLAFAADTYEFGAFDPTDYAQDIVWADGFFVKWPQNIKVDGGAEAPAP